MPISLLFACCKHKAHNIINTYFKQLKYLKINVLYVFCDCFVIAKRKKPTQRVKILLFYHQVNILIFNVVREHKCFHSYYTQHT